MEELKPGRYRHFKGNEYQLIEVARHSETLEPMVVYQALYGEHGLWVRPASMWSEHVERDGYSGPRFTYMGTQKNRPTAAETEYQPMAKLEYIPNAGQTYIPFAANTGIPTLPFTPPDRPIPEYPTPAVIPVFEARGYVLGDCAQHFLPGVTADMLDWFWANMEKCYYLWAPGSHKRFNWVKPPVTYGFVNSAHIISEVKGGSGEVFGGEGVQINRMDLDQYPLNLCLEHVIMECVRNDAGEFVDSTIHMWEDVPGGVNHVVCTVFNTRASAPPSFVFENPAAMPTKEENAAHTEYECSQWPKFLPQLYALWEGHPDPSQNVACDLRVRQREDGRWEYVAKNGPVAPPRGV